MYIYIYIYIYIYRERERERERERDLNLCLFGYYGLSIFVGYLMSNIFLYKYTVLFQTIQFSMSTRSLTLKNFSIQKNSV